MATLCLNMIVKNESEIIAQTLENLCNHIDFDYWVIADTGSTDNTVEIIQQFFAQKQIRGEIFSDEWKNFAHNRNLALAHCEGKTDFVLFFDADDEIQGNWRLDKNLQHDAYYMQLSSASGSTRYQRKLIVRNNGNFYWRGVVHEYIENKQPISVGTIHGDYLVISGRKGARNQDPLQKYQRDAELLEQALAENLDEDLRPRYLFYLAQSYKDAEMPEKATAYYKLRAETPEGWSDERYYSYLQLGFLSEDHDAQLACHYWQQAVKIAPERAEAWYHLARRHSWNKNYPIAYAFAAQAVECPYPRDSRLFLNKAIYDYWGWYELCLCAFNIDKKAHSYQAFKQLLTRAPQHLIVGLKGLLPYYRTYIDADTLQEVRQIQQQLQRYGIEFNLD